MKIKELYGFDKTASKWSMKGGELLKHIGAEVVCVKYVKDNLTQQWTNSVHSVKIINMTDYSMGTVSYRLDYCPVGETEIKSLRILPDGYSYEHEEVDESIIMYRFLSYSLHSKIVEDEYFYNQLPILFTKRKSLPSKFLQVLSESGKSEEILSYQLNIIAIIKNTNNEYYQFRISKVKSINVLDDVYSVDISDEFGNMYTISYSDRFEEHIFNVDKEIIGKIKIIDIQGIE